MYSSASVHIAFLPRAQNNLGNVYSSCSIHIVCVFKTFHPHTPCVFKLYLILFPNMDGLKNIILLQFHSGSQPPPPPTHLVFVAADRKRCIFFFLSDSLQPASHSRLPRNPPKILPGESRFFHFSHLPLSICNIG